MSRFQTIAPAEAGIAPPSVAALSPRPEAASAYVIEFGGTAAGIVAADGRSYRFHAASPRFGRLEGQQFRTPAEAERAARRLEQDAKRRTPARHLSYAHQANGRQQPNISGERP